MIFSIHKGLRTSNCISPGFFSPRQVTRSRDVNCSESALLALLSFRSISSQWCVADGFRDRKYPIYDSNFNLYVLKIRPRFRTRYLTAMCKRQ